MKNKKLLILALLILMGSLFYWFQYRPAQIKHDCSWVKEVEAAIPSYPAMTENQLKQKGIVTNCSVSDDSQTKTLDTFSTAEEVINQRRQELCLEQNQKIVELYRKPRNAVPEKEHWRKATNEEYKFCLRDKGL